MKRWMFPLAVFGLGSLGALVASDRGREALQWAAEQIDEAPERMLAWNEAAQQELDRIQMAVHQLAETLTEAHG